MYFDFCGRWDEAGVETSKAVESDHSTCRSDELLESKRRRDSLM